MLRLDHKHPRPVYGDRLGFWKSVGYALIAWAGIIALLFIYSTSP